MSICIHIPFYNPEPDRLEGYRKLTRYDYLKENIKSLKNLSSSTDIFINTHNNFLDDKKLDAKIIVHKLSKENLEKGKLTWLTRKNMALFQDQYDYFIYIEHDIRFTKSNFEYWKFYNKNLKEKKLNLGFLIYEKNNEDNTKYCIHIPTKINKILEMQNQQFAINDIENYCCFWIYEKKLFKKFINSKYWNLNLEITNYRHRYGNTERVALGLHALNFDYFKATVIPLINNRLDKRCFIEHMTNNYFYMFKDVKFSYSDLRSACRFKIDQLLGSKIKYYSEIPKYLNFKDKILWKLKFIRKIWRFVKKFNEK